ncbi:MAG TPA: maltotransferase domain-containing protein, partial [bacterium]|nr:maltotransferase domain-containing protein [bacterium]
MTTVDNASRVVIERVEPEVDCGRFPIKRTVGEQVIVEADIFADGPELLGAVLQYRRDETSRWTEAPMTLVDNDRWQGAFTVSDVGRYRYTLQAWVDRFASWSRDLRRIVAARQDADVELEIGSTLVRAAG